MRLLFESRASTILYNFLKSSKPKNPFIPPANVCPIVPITFLKAKVPFVFFDISPNDYYLSKNETLKQINKNKYKYSGVLFVHTYGAYTDNQSFFKKIKDINDNLYIIDDRCLCEPTFFPKDNNSDLIMYSTGAKKFVDLNCGGFGFIKKDVKYYRQKLPFNKNDLENIKKKYKKAVSKHSKFSYNDSDWLDTFKPKISFDEYKKNVLDYKQEIKKHKKKINQIYRDNLPNRIFLPEKYQRWRFNLKVPKKEELLKNIFNENLFASSHYVPLNNIFGPGNGKTAKLLYNTIINLFNDGYINPQQALKLTDVINTHLKENYKF